ncbi:MAG: hypothetical protein NTZ90_02530 [Proteobacteria bacterium]|jgi:hypothetical protein|nr:hypothetical protein [Pseudomonadota bacterium]
MQRDIASEHLPRLIARCGADALNRRQIAKRLQALLPTRYLEIKLDHRRRGLAPAAADRQALIDQRYTDFVQELSDMTFAAHQARIEYETHAMLYKARQSLRYLHQLHRPRHPG